MRDDDLLSDALSRLERVPASPGFTARTLARLDEAAEPSTWTPRRQLATLAALLLLVLAGSAGYDAWHSERQAARRAELLREHEALERDVASLRSLLAASQPRIQITDRRGAAVDVDLVELQELASDLRAGSGRGSKAIFVPLSF